MLKKDFWYDLPKELIAQEPADPRDAARLMVLDRKNDKILHSVFHELPHYLEKGDLLVVNNSKVLPARLMGTKVPTGAVCELLLLRQVKGDTWECLARPGKRMQPGTKVEFGDGSLTAVVDETLPDGNKHVTFSYDTETLYEKLDEFGKMPLPPYITKQLEDQSQYQTVYAKELGSAAAPWRKRSPPPGKPQPAGICWRRRISRKKPDRKWKSLPAAGMWSRPSCMRPEAVWSPSIPLPTVFLGSFMLWAIPPSCWPAPKTFKPASPSCKENTTRFIWPWRP